MYSLEVAEKVERISKKTAKNLKHFIG